VLQKFIYLFIALFIQSNSLWGDKTSLSRETQLLEAELAIAQKPQIYFIFLVRDKKIQLKAKGIVLKEWEIQNIRHFGNAPPPKPISLVKKSTLFPPKRKKIKPGSVNEEAEFKLATLELKDMPGIYTLSLEGGTPIFIRPQPRSFFSRLRNIWHSFRWYTLPPLEKLWFSLRKRPFTAIDIVFKDKKDSQALYWAFIEGSECIIF